MIDISPVLNIFVNMCLKQGYVHHVNHANFYFKEEQAKTKRTLIMSSMSIFCGLIPKTFFASENRLPGCSGFRSLRLGSEKRLPTTPQLA